MSPTNIVRRWNILEKKSACKKVVSDSPRLVDFAIVLVNSVLNLTAWRASEVGAHEPKANTARAYTGFCCMKHA